jgi:thiamine-phosphate pyrophosphorylase
MNNDDERSRAAILRIVDANVNRCAEGIRVVEELARFFMESAAVVEELKEIRHAVRHIAREIPGLALAHRDSGADVGRASATPSETRRGSLVDIARANFARAEEALRVLEEFGKLIDPTKARAFKQLRFRLYAVEKAHFLGAGRAVMPRAPFLYAILDRSLVPAERVPETAACLVAGGADMVQYRAKEVSDAGKRLDLVALLAAAIEMMIPVIVNDDCELACEMGASGVHVGAADCPPEEARRMLGPGRIVGLSVHSEEQLERLPLESLDYIAVGAIYPSPTKPEAAVKGLDFLRLARRRVDIPIVAIGGITPVNVAEVFDAGADGVAVVSSILAGDIRKNCFTLRQIIDTKVKR